MIETIIWRIWNQNEEKEINRLMQVGMQAMQEENYDQALEIFNQVIKQAPTFAEGWNKRAIVYYLKGDYEASIEDITRTLSLEPRHFGALSGLGIIYFDQGKYHKSLGAFQEALKANPHLKGARQNVEVIQQYLREHVI